MISKSQISFVKSLHQKKHRKEHNLFIIEGSKSVIEFINSKFTIDTIFFTANVSPKLTNLSATVKLQEITEAELTKISTLTTPQSILALVQIPKAITPPSHLFIGTYTLILDGIQDPGNLGTIIRTADWFGFKNIVCSNDTVETYNPKAVQASMGSLSRMEIFYTHLPELLNSISVPIYGALLTGQSVYKTQFENEGILILGNEGKGISEGVIKKIQYPVTIPRFGEAESLNVAASAAIFCSEIKRNTVK